VAIFAHHAHVFPDSVNPDGTIERLLRLLDACDIDGAVCFAPFPYQVVGKDLDPNQWLAKRLATQPRLAGFGTIDMHRGDIAEQVRIAAELGLKGLKLHPQVQEFDLLSKEAFEAYGAAQERNLFITFHSGVHHYRIKSYRVLDFDEVAEHFPNLRFSLEHIGGYSFFHEALAVITNRIPFPPVPGKRCNVFGGLSSIFTHHYNRYWYMNRERLEEVVAQVGPELLIFGLDFPYNLEENTKIGIARLRELGLPAADLDLILGGNIRREIGLQ